MGEGSYTMPILAFLILLSVLILIHEIGHLIVARRFGVRIERFSLGFGPKVFGIKRGATEYVISLIPLGGYVKMAGEDESERIAGVNWQYLSKPVGKRALIVGAGPFFNYILAIIIFILVFMLGNPQLTTKIGEVMEGYPAKLAGLAEGDKIIAVDGQKVKFWEELKEVVQKNKEKTLVLTALRDKKEFKANIKPKLEEAKDLLGRKKEVGLLGIVASDEVVFVKYPPQEAIYLGTLKVFQITGVTYIALGRMMTGKLAVRESVTGPIGIFQITTRAAMLGFIYLMQMTAILSACLAIFNLLPIPVLDGGHILFLAIEKIKGRKIEQRFQEAFTKLGLAALITLMIFVTYNDLVREGILEKVITWFQR